MQTWWSFEVTVSLPFGENLHQLCPYSILSSLSITAEKISSNTISSDGTIIDWLIALDIQSLNFAAELPTPVEPIHQNNTTMDTNPNPEVAPPISLEPEHEMNETAGQPYVNNQDIPETTETTETTESTVVEGTHDTGYNHEEQAHQNTYPAEFTSSQQNYFPAEDEQNSSRFSSPTMSYQQNPQQSVSRPGSGLSSGGERYGYPSSQPEQNQKQAAVPSKNSVVIKVGMVGDAQIGKTSLMVKYVEGSWDEDYIQTLGECDLSYSQVIVEVLANWRYHRRQFHGEDHFDS